MKNTLEKKGIISPILLIVGAVVAVAVIGVGVWFALHRASDNGQKAGREATTEQALDDLTVAVPSLDVSASPLGALELSSFDLGSDVGSPSFGSVTVNDSFGYSADLSLATPTVNLTAPTNVKVSVPSQPAPSAPSAPPAGTTTPPAGSGSSGSSGSAPAVNSATCAQFAGVPSCAMIPDPNGQELCEDCRAAGF